MFTPALPKAPLGGTSAQRVTEKIHRPFIVTQIVGVFYYASDIGVHYQVWGAVTTHLKARYSKLGPS